MSNVDHPSHYGMKNGLEAIDIMDAACAELDGLEAEYMSQILKYLLRWKKKNGVEDLEKARWYLDRFISIKKGTRGRAQHGTTCPNDGNLCGFPDGYSCSKCMAADKVAMMPDFEEDEDDRK